MNSMVLLQAKGALDFLPPAMNEYLIPGVMAGCVFAYMLYKILKLTGKIDF